MGAFITINAANLPLGGSIGAIDLNVLRRKQSLESSGSSCIYTVAKTKREEEEEERGKGDGGVGSLHLTPSH